MTSPQATARRTPPHFATLPFLLAVSLLGGCGKSRTSQDDVGPKQVTAGGATAGNAAGELGQAATGDAKAAANTPAKPSKPAETVDDEVRVPATVEQALRAIDLRTLPLVPGADNRGEQSATQLMYQAANEVKPAADAIRKQLADRGWKKIPADYGIETSSADMFTRDGFILQLTIGSYGEPGKVTIMLKNQGNVNLRMLPKPPGVATMYSFPHQVGYTTSATRDDTVAVVKKLLSDDGWTPYGVVADSMYWKKNAVKLHANVSAPDSQAGKVFITYSCEQMSADLPPPPNALELSYDDGMKRLSMDTPGSSADLIAHYQTTLGPTGWKPTTDHPITDGPTGFLIFRNAAGDLVRLDYRDLADDKKTRATLTYQTAAEVAEESKRAKAAAAEQRAKSESKKNKPKPRVKLTLPDDASEVEASAANIEFHLSTGKAKDAVEALGKELKAAGWKQVRTIGDKAAGERAFEKDGCSISVTHVDPGLIPAEITVR